jgi:thymidylate synthase
MWDERHIPHLMLCGLLMYCHSQLKTGDIPPPLQYVSEVMARAKDEGKRVDTIEKMITTIRDTRWGRKRVTKKANKSFIFHSCI